MSGVTVQVGAAMGLAETQMHVVRVEALVYESNAASRKVLSKNGFAEESRNACKVRPSVPPSTQLPTIPRSSSAAC